MAKSSDPIYDILKKEIVTLQITPATMLREVDIASRFNVSRTPVRDVFVRLERDNLLEVISQKGTYVTKINVNEISEIMYIRQTIESDIIKTLVDKITPDQVDILKLTLLRQNEILLLEDSFERKKLFYDNDNQFHQTMFSFCGKEGVWNIISNLSPTYNRYRNVTFLRRQDRLKQLYDYHVQLLNCIENKDLDGALNALKGHFISGLSGIEAVYQDHKNYFL